MLWQIAFGLSLVGAAYIVNKVINWDKLGLDYMTLFGLRRPIPWFMVNFFLAVVTVLWILGLFGVGR